MPDKFFKILSLDGGGVRGIYSAQILSRMESDIGINIHDEFDLLVGTSTGSIIAAAIAIKYDLQKLVEKYEKAAPHIFSKRRGCGLLRSRYDSSKLEEFLHDELGEFRLGDIKIPLMLNATNASDNEVCVFKSSYQKEIRGKEEYRRDGNILLRDAVKASCAAPLYFDPVNIEDKLYCDGGIWANNPAIVGYVEAITNFRQRAENIKIFSIGTGKSSNSYKLPPSSGIYKKRGFLTGKLPQFFRIFKEWGFLTKWEKYKLIDFVMTCQTEFPANSLELMMKERFFREPSKKNPLNEDWGLDKCENIPTMKETANNRFEKLKNEIREFLDRREL